MTQVMGVRAARWISSLVVCGLVSVALHMSGTTSARAAMAQDRTSEQDKPSLRQVTVGVPQSFPPYYLLDEYGNPSGFAVDTMNEVAKRAGLLVTYRVKKNWGEIFKALRTGDIDIVPNLGITNRRKEYAAYTVPLETFHISIFVRDDTHDVKGLGDLSGRPVAVVATNAARRILKSRDDIQLRVFDNFTEALFALLSAEVDAFAFPEPVTWKLAREARVDKQIKVVGEPLKEIRRGMAVPKDKVELLAVLDRAVRDFVASPEYRKVYVAWFGKPDPYWTVARVAWTMGGLIAVLFLFMGWWRYRVGVRMIQVSQKSEKRLRGAIESLQEGFELFDADDRLVMINSRYQEIHPRAQEFLDKGMRFEDVMRANVAAGRMVEALGREEEFIRERLEQHRNPGPPILRQYNDGKWYIITETRTPEGGIAITLSDITELQAAKEAREKLSTAVENVPVGIALFDSDDRLVFFNNRYGELMEVVADILKPGVTFEEMIRTLVDRQPVKDARGREEEFIQERIKHHRNPTGPFDIRRENAWLMADEIRLSDGGIFTIVTDVTEQKRAEAAREEAEERFRDVAEAASDWFWEMGPDLRFTYHSERYFEITGFRPEEKIGTTRTRYVDPTDREADAEKWAAHLADLETHKPFKNFEFSFTSNTGRVCHARISGTPVFDADGGFLGYRGTGTDITERKRAEEALRESEERLRTIAANIPGNVYRRILHADGRLTWAYLSAGLRDILELDPDAAMERPEVLIETVHPEDRARWQDALRKSAETLEPYDLEFRRMTPSGKVVWLRSIARPHRRQNGDVVWDGVALDITEQKEAQAQLIRTSRLATLGEMASGIAHELNQPLSVVGMAAENSLISMEEGTFDTEFVRKKLQTIVGQRDRMAGIVNHMRLFSRRDTTAMELFDPVECVRGAVGLIAKQFQALGIELEEDLPAACRNVFGHPVQLEQVVLNLLNNARDAVRGAVESAGSGQGRPVPKVRISLVDDKGRKTVVISVADNGGGIPEEAVKRIFDPFFTTKKKGQGTGLGLSISYSIVDAMGGRLEAQNADGGVEFRISVPAAVDGSGAVDRRSREKKRKAGTRKRRSGLPRILVVDDEEGIAEELAEYLQLKGYDVATAGSGLEALELYRSRPADIVITDLLMPEMDGNELIRRLRRTDPDLPIMLVTGHTTFGDEKESVTEGASVVLKKPIDLSELLGTLSNMVRH